ncbi:MAG: membrane protein insertion efficiency factor YidD [Patescibacteria group bacterium]
MSFLGRLPNKIVVGLILIYQKVFSPSLGFLRFLPFYPKPNCIFYPSCSEYGAACFRNYNFFKALRKTLGRIGRCHPGNDPRVDLP